MKRPLACVLILLTLMMLTGCQQNSDQLSGSNPVTLTMWHVYADKRFPCFSVPFSDLKGIFKRVSHD